MTDDFPRRTSLESLKKEAKRWLSALRAQSSEARARLDRAVSDAPASPTLRDTQHALAREHGFEGWTELKRAIERAGARDREQATAALAQYEAMAAALLDAYRTGTPEAMERHYGFTWHRRAWPAMRTYVQLDLGKRPETPGADVEININDARYLVARDHGFDDWMALRGFVAANTGPVMRTAKPMHVGVAVPKPGRVLLSTHDWQVALEMLRSTPNVAFNPSGELTDAMLKEVSAIENVDSLNLSTS